MPTSARTSVRQLVHPCPVDGLEKNSSQTREVYGHVRADTIYWGFEVDRLPLWIFKVCPYCGLPLPATLTEWNKGK